MDLVTPVRIAREVFETYAAEGEKAATTPLQKLQCRLAAWQGPHFGASPGWQTALGVNEEVGELFTELIALILSALQAGKAAGELAHAVLKHAQGIRGLGSHDAYLAKAGDAIGDVVVYAINHCTGLRLDFESLIHGTAEAVMARVGPSLPSNGREPYESPRIVEERKLTLREAALITGGSGIIEE